MVGDHNQHGSRRENAMHDEQCDLPDIAIPRREGVLRERRHRPGGRRDIHEHLLRRLPVVLLRCVPYIVTEKAGFLVLVYSNFLGPILGSGYVFGFWKNCQDSDAIRRLYNYMGIATTLFLMQILVMCTEPCQKALFFSGFISSVCSVMVSLSMLATVPRVFETKCSSSINVTVTIVGVVSALLWLTCGCILKDKWIMVPNSIGLVILVFTLSLTVRFPQDEESARALLAASSSEECLQIRAAEIGEAAVMIRTALDSVPEYGTCSERRSVLGKPMVPYSGDTGGTF